MCWIISFFLPGCCNPQNLVFLLSSLLLYFLHFFSLTQWINGKTPFFIFSLLRKVWLWLILSMDREAWCAAVHGVAKSCTWLSDRTEVSYPNLTLAYSKSPCYRPHKLHHYTRYCGYTLNTWFKGSNPHVNFQPLFLDEKLSLREVFISHLLKVLVQASGKSGFHPGLSAMSNSSFHERRKEDQKAKVKCWKRWGKMETVTDLISTSKITADGDCS